MLVCFLLICQFDDLFQTKLKFHLEAYQNTKGEAVSKSEVSLTS